MRLTFQELHSRDFPATCPWSSFWIDLVVKVGRNGVEHLPPAGDVLAQYALGKGPSRHILAARHTQTHCERVRLVFEHLCQGWDDLSGHGGQEAE